MSEENLLLLLCDRLTCATFTGSDQFNLWDLNFYLPAIHRSSASEPHDERLGRRKSPNSFKHTDVIRFGVLVSTVRTECEKLKMHLVNLHLNV